MRKHLFIVLGTLFAVAALASLGFAGDYHKGATLQCQQCHVMHYSQTHGYNANGGGITTPLGASGPYHYLLRDDINDLCLSCHDGGGFAPDVFESNADGYARQAGGLNDLASAGPYYPADGHTLNSTDAPPGYVGTWAGDPLNCTNCHGAHGAGFGTAADSYRNLGGYGTLVGSGLGIPYSYGTNDLTTWVFEANNSGNSENHYGQSAIIFNEPDQTTSQYANVCKACHTEFHGLVGGSEIGGTGSPPEEFVRHPAAGVNIGAVGGGHSSLTQFAGHTNQVQVMSKNGLAAGSYTADPLEELTQSCMSCHKGHGNQNSFGLIYMSGTGTVNEQGDTGPGVNGPDPGYKDLCKQCHGQG
jgi:hypothetical protein